MYGEFNDEETKGVFVKKQVACLIAVLMIAAVAGLIAIGILYGQQPKCQALEAITTQSDLQESTMTSSTTQPTTTSKPEPQINYRLPKFFKPNKYEIEIKSKLKESNFTFFGSVKVDLSCRSNSYSIILHSKDLTIKDTSIKLFLNESYNMRPISITYDKVTDFLNLTFSQELEANKDYTLEISDFQGTIIQHDLRGFYNSSYEIDGEKRYLAATQFQPTHARRAFPCFDEPEWKAIFEITIVRPTHLKSLSNAELSRQENRSEDLIADIYEPTPIMSTYLVAFVISDFESNQIVYSRSDGTQVNIRSWARPNAVNELSYSLEVGKSLLGYFENKLKLTYQLNKLDMIALPDFDAGAMENWGLVTFRELLLLADSNSPWAVKKRVADIIAHEIAHMWFGNLVTCEWWNQLWLNEGFGRYFQYVAINEVEPSWNMLNHLYVDHLQSILDYDALPNSHSIITEVSSPLEVWSLFDSITYSKGAWIIRMMESFLTQPVLFNGLTNYLNNNAYDVADQEELFVELTKAVNNSEHPFVDVSNVMKSWTSEKGYPLITVENSNGNIKLSQKPFQVSTKLKEENQLWYVYLTYKTNNQETNSTWLKTSVSSIELEGNYDWILFNIDVTGLYRVNYNEDNWKKLLQQLKSNHTKINLLNRAQILEDALTFASNGLLNYSLVLDLVSYLENETEYIPWAAGKQKLNFIKNVLDGEEVFYFKTTMQKLIKNIYTTYKNVALLQQLPFQEQYTATLVIEEACEYGNEECIRDILELYKNENIPSSLLNIAYCTAIRYGLRKDWDNIFSIYKKTLSTSDKRNILIALTCSKEVDQLYKLLHLAKVENDDIKSQDARYVFAGIAKSEFGKNIFWNFLRHNWKTLVDHFGFALSSTVSSAMNNWASTTSSKNSLEELESFKKHIDEDLKKSKPLETVFVNAVYKINLNIQWRNKYIDSVFQWYQDSLNPVSSVNPTFETTNPSSISTIGPITDSSIAITLTDIPLMPAL